MVLPGLPLLAAVAFAATPAPAPVDPAAGLPETLRPIAAARKLRFASAWGEYLMRPGGPVLAVSPDGTRAASGGARAPLRIFDLETGRQSRVLAGSDDAACAAFSPDGRRLAAGNHDGTIVVWDLATGRAERTLKRHAGAVVAVAFSPDGALLASGGEDGGVRLWTLATGRAVVLSGHADLVRAIAFFTHFGAGAKFATASDDGTVRVWDTAAADAPRIFGAPDGPEALSVALSPEGGRLLVGRRGVGIESVDLASGQTRLLGAFPHVLAVAFSEDGARAMAIVRTAPDARPSMQRGGEPPQVEVRSWNAATGAAFPLLVQLDEAAVAAAFAEGGRRAVTTGAGLAAWELSTGAPLRRARGHVGRVSAVAFSNDGKLVLTGGDDGTARVWDALAGEERAILGGYARSVRAIAFHPDSRRALVGDAYGLVRLWDLGQIRDLLVVGPHRGLLSLAFAAEGRAVASISLERTALWSVETGKEIASGWFQRLVDRAALSGDGTLALTLDPEDGVLLREVGATRPQGSLVREGSLPRSALLSRDGTLAAVVWAPPRGPVEVLEVWDTAKATLVSTAKVPPGAVPLAFSGDGRLLVMAGERAFGLLDTSTLREIERVDLRPNGEQPTAAAFSPDALALLVGTSTGALLQFRLAFPLPSRPVLSAPPEPASDTP